MVANLQAQQRPLRRARPGRGLDGGVRRQRLDHPPGARVVPARQVPAAGRGHGDLPGQALGGPVHEQRRACSTTARIWSKQSRRQDLGGASRASPRRCTKKHDIGGYAGQFLAYEGLTVNFSEAVQSAGGQILSPDGTKVTLDPAKADDRAWTSCSAGPARRLDPRGVAALQGGGVPPGLPGGPARLRPQLAARVRPGHGSGSATSSRSPGCPGSTGPGSSSLGGVNLAVSAFSKHQQTAQRVHPLLHRAWRTSAGCSPTARSRRCGPSSTTTPS